MPMMAFANRPPPKTEKFSFGPWLLVSRVSHILQSEGPERERFDSALELPNLPEMIFGDNILRLQFADQLGVEFNALDALKCVDAHHDLMKVAVAREWQEARADDENIKNLAQPYDWTYSTNYKGTLFSEGQGFEVQETTEEIDIEKLKKREKIMFFADVLLYEDELSDHGSAVLNVKVRVMPTSFFILQRFYLRVDGVIIRVNDTRLYHEAGWDYVLREYSSRESPMSELQVPDHVLLDKNEIWQHLPVKSQHREKLVIPADLCQSVNESEQVSS